jgi:hypothetical protein
MLFLVRYNIKVRWYSAIVFIKQHLPAIWYIAAAQIMSSPVYSIQMSMVHFLSSLLADVYADFNFLTLGRYA